MPVDRFPFHATYISGKRSTLDTRHGTAYFTLSFPQIHLRSMRLMVNTPKQFPPLFVHKHKFAY
jgi:hypothetical protein